MKKWSRHTWQMNSSGFTMISFLVIALVIGGSIALMLTYVRNITRETQRHATSTEAFNAAEAGLRRALFMLQAKETWTYFTTNATVAWTNLSGGAEYTFAFSNITADAITVTATGRKRFEKGYSYRKIQADVEHPIPEAFSYGCALFGNNVGFHNHMEVPYGLAITSKIFSNGEILFWRGLTMDGDMTAVGRIVRGTTPASCPATIINGTFLDGTPSSEFYAPNHSPDPQPVPSPIPYPEFDFASASNTAVASGTYFASAAAFTNYIAAHTTNWVLTNRQAYAFPSPLPSNPTNTRSLSWFNTSTHVTYTGIVSKAVLSNALFYIKGDLTLAAECNTLLVITNAGIVVNGKFTVKRPFELYAASNMPAVAATGKIDITDKDHTDGDGGPVNIRGIIYTEAECHIHQSDPYNAVSVAGIEVANYVHNCEWFWFNYTAWPGVKGFSEGPGAQGLVMKNWREVVPAGPP